ncbi:MAG: glycosyltransferase family 4 protein [Nitrososphaerales archaeon]
MKICYAAVDVALPHYRGASTHVYEVAKHLAILGNEVHVVARRADSSEPKNAKLGEIEILRLYRGIVFSSKKSSFAAGSDSKGSYRGNSSRITWKLYEIYLRTIFPFYAGIVIAFLVRREKIDVILERETSFGAGAVGSILSRRPLVLEVIGNRVTRLQLWRARKIIAYSKSMFEGRVDDSKIEIVTAGVDTELFKPDEISRKQIRARYSLEDREVIGFVGTFQEWHGVGEILEASRLVLASHPKAAFLMVGPYFNATEKKARALGLPGSPFVFTGPVPYEKVPEYLSACDVLIAPYNPDKIESKEQVRKHPLGSPLKMFEYMATGKPVITTSVEPMTAIIEDRMTGLLIPPGDSRALAKAILELLDNEDLSRRLGEDGKQLVLRRYSWLGVVGRISSVLKDAAGHA